jgi:hypothetical protein
MLSMLLLFCLLVRHLRCLRSGGLSCKSSKDFAENPIGVDFDPEEMIRRIQQGENEEILQQRPNIGPRGLPNHLQ